MLPVMFLKGQPLLPVCILKVLFLSYSTKYFPIIYLMERRSTYEEIQSNAI